MPLARRLSTSSHEAFEEFCSKNQPLSRRFSVGGDTASIRSSSRRESISSDRGHRVLKCRNHSRTRTIARVTRSTTRKDERATRSPEPKKQRISRSRSKRNNDKENDSVGNRNTVSLLSHPRQWKVDKDRENKFSPRLTRSAKKKKLQKLSDQPQKDGVLLFSPPNQADNARRENMNRERRLQER